MSKNKKSKFHSPEETLRNKLDENLSIGKELIGKGRFLTDEGQKLIDRANALKGLLDTSPHYINYENQINYYEQMNISYKSYIENNRANIKYVYSGGTLSTTSSSDIEFGLPENLNPTLYPSHDALKIAQLSFDNWLEVHSTEKLKVEVIELLNSWGLDKGYSRDEPPLKLFQIALAAFEHPVIDEDPVSSSLVPLRGCILNVLESLLSLRPEKENYSKAKKVFAIGKQLKLSNLDIEIFTEFDERWKILHKSLSNAKTEEMTRELWRKYIHEGMLLIINILQGLDIEKVRSN